MALYKEKTTKEGVEVSYWKITGFNVDVSRPMFVIDITPWVSKAAHEAGRNPVSSERMTVRVTDVIYPEDEGRENSMHYSEYFAPASMADGSIYTTMYTYLKTHVDFFKDAEDA